MQTFFNNPHVVVPALTFVITQSIKMYLKARKGDFNWKYMFATGDMPSVHTAVSTSIVVSLGFVEGVGSAVFALGALWALFIIYDSFNVRRAVGEQGGVILKLIEISKGPKEERDLMKVREVLGHTPLEVSAGAGVGLGLGFLLSYGYWPETLRSTLVDVNESEIKMFYALFGLVLALGLIIRRFIVPSAYRKLPTGKMVRRSIRSVFILPGVLGWLLVWLQSEGIELFESKFPVVLLLMWIVVAGATQYFRLIRFSRQRMVEEFSHIQQARRQERKHRLAKKRSKKR
jgi:hypothetical protein